MTKHSRFISLEERIIIEKNKDKNIPFIAKLLLRSIFAIRSEFNRSGGQENYKALEAQLMFDAILKDKKRCLRLSLDQYNFFYEDDFKEIIDRQKNKQRNVKSCLDFQDRKDLETLIKKYNISNIKTAQILRRSNSMICREINMCVGRFNYTAIEAQRIADDKSNKRNISQKRFSEIIQQKIYQLEQQVEILINTIREMKTNA